MILAKWSVEVYTVPRDPENVVTNLSRTFRPDLTPADKTRIMALIQQAVTTAIAEERSILGKIENLDKTSALLDELHEVAKRWNALSKQVVQELSEEQS